MGKTGLPDEAAENLKIGLRLSGKTHDEAGAQSGLREDAPDPIHHGKGILDKGTAHAGKDVPGRMLQGDIKVRHQRRSGVFQKEEQLSGQAGGVQIHQPQAFQAGQRQQQPEKMGQTARERQIRPPGSEILSHQDEFPYSLSKEPGGLVAQKFGRHAAQGYSNGGDGTEGTGLPAAFADLEPGVGRACGEKTERCATLGERRRAGRQGSGAGGEAFAQGGVDLRRPGGHFPGFQEKIRFRQIRGQFLFAETADQASGHCQKRAFVRRQGSQAGDALQDHPHGFLHSRGNKGAGVNEDEVRRLHFLHRAHPAPQRPGFPQGLFRIHQVFRTAETD